MRVVEAAPADAIRHLVEQTEADLVVMGTHGRSGVNRLMLGLVTERVLRGGRGSGAGGADVQRAGGDPKKNILCPVAITAASRAAFAAASWLTSSGLT